MNLLLQDAAATNYLNKLYEETGRTNFQNIIWEQRDDLQEAFKQVSSPLFSEWIISHGLKEYELLSGLNEQPSTRLPRTLKFSQRPFGVNLIIMAQSSASAKIQNAGSFRINWHSNSNH